VVVDDRHRPRWACLSVAGLFFVCHQASPLCDRPRRPHEPSSRAFARYSMRRFHPFSPVWRTDGVGPARPVVLLGRASTRVARAVPPTPSQRAARRSSTRRGRPTMSASASFRPRRAALHHRRRALPRPPAPRRGVVRRSGRVVEAVRPRCEIAMLPPGSAGRADRTGPRSSADLARRGRGRLRRHVGRTAAMGRPAYRW
jgi:hypothetical protein